MCALVETAHMCFRVRAGIVSCTSHHLVVKYVPKEWPLLEGRTGRLPEDCGTGTARRSGDHSNPHPRVRSHCGNTWWLQFCICGPTCSWLEHIYCIMKEVCPARSPVFWFSVSEKAPASALNVLTQKQAGEMDGAVLAYACWNRLEDCVSTNPSAERLALAGDPAN